MKATKKLDALLAKWKTARRETPSVVRHATNGIETQVDPLQFAVYETAIKAVYSSWQLSGMMTAVMRQWYQSLARKDGITLPGRDDLGRISSQDAASDYRYCVKLLSDDGLYRELLD